MRRIQQVNPDIGRLERKYVRDTLNRRWITEGIYAGLFLDEIKRVTGAKYSVLAPNGTLAIYMALYALGIKKWDRVVVPDFTFNASASPLHFLNAKPVFCDIDPDTYQIDVGMLEELVESYDVKAIIPVHLFGQSADMRRVMGIADAYHILVMEDAAQGLGVIYQDRHVGTIGDAGIFAFFADKNIVMGEGGVVVTDDRDIYMKLCYLRNQGRYISGHFVHNEMGMNFRLTDMQCAVGYAQMKRMRKLFKRKQCIYQWYKKYLPSTVKMMRLTPGSTHIPLRCPILVDDKEIVKIYLERNGIDIRDMSLPLHRNPCWHGLGYRIEDFPNANRVYESGMLLPLHTKLSERDVRYICSRIEEIS